MALFEINEKSSIPIWLQLKNRFIYLITSGYYKPGDQLPTVRGLAAAVEAGVVNDHQAAPHRYRDAGPEQVGPAPHPVGNVGHWEAEAQGGPALVGRRGEKKLHAGLHILGTPLSKF